MEIKNYLYNYINVFDDSVSKDMLEIFYKVCKDHKEFYEGRVVSDLPEGKINKDSRNVKIWEMESLLTKSFTQIYWTNFFVRTFQESIIRYSNNLNMSSSHILQDIQTLKYDVGGHYKFHVDNGVYNHRTISCIFFVNDEYEGGDLLFKFPNEDQPINIAKRKNRMVVWPSNFLYPHCVTPVTSGERYSVVAWAK